MSSKGDNDASNYCPIAHVEEVAVFQPVIVVLDKNAHVRRTEWENYFVFLWADPSASKPSLLHEFVDFVFHPARFTSAYAPIHACAVLTTQSCIALDG